MNKPNPLAARIEFRNENGEYHNEHGFAVELYNGTREWHLNGELSRQVGPAVIDSRGGIKYFLDGKLHNLTGPAIIQPNGRCSFWREGIQYDIDSTLGPQEQLCAFFKSIVNEK